MIDIDSALEKYLPEGGVFDYFMEISGEEFRNVKNRRTVSFFLGEKRYFIKVHRGCGWGEIFRELSQLRLPTISAEREWEGIALLEELDVATMRVVGKGKRGWLPASIDSFIITEALEDMVSLEDLVLDWGGLTGKRAIALKQTLIVEIARISRKIHGRGMNHRDYYICHFLVKSRDWSQWKIGEGLRLHLIDLHRVQIRSRVPTRWLVKDLGALLFSALDCGLTSGDVLRFVEICRGMPWRESLKADAELWKAVIVRAIRLYTSFHGKDPVLPRIMTLNKSERAVGPE